MIKSDLIKALAAQHPDLHMEVIEMIIAAFFDEIAARMAANGRIELRGFGSFSTRARDGRIGRNPRTGETIVVGGKRVPYFKPGKELRVRIDASAQA